jgi:hypothetical protein
VNWTIVSYGGNKVINFKCSDCGQSKSRETTVTEQKIISCRQNLGKGIHEVYHSFAEVFVNRNNTFKLLGYDLMTAIESWAEKQPPGYVRITGCDDSHHLSSMIVLIEHKNKDYYMGTTMIMIPQNNDEPQELFLYPYHVKELQNTLDTLIAEAAQVTHKQERINARLKTITDKWKP